MIDLDNREKYSHEVGKLSSDCVVLSSSALNDINQVFYADGAEQELSATDLSIRYVTAEKYHDLIAGPDIAEFEPKTLYVVSSDQINAYNTQIKNVADPVDNRDAANKSWVEQSVANALISAVEHSDAQLSVIDNKLDRCKDGCTIDSKATIAWGSGAVAKGN